MSECASLMISFVALVWVFVGIVSLEFDSLVEDKPVTLRDVIAAFMLEPSLIFIGVLGFVLIVFWRRTSSLMWHILKYDAQPAKEDLQCS